MATEQQRMDALGVGKPLPGDERNALVWDGREHVIVTRREAALGWLRWSEANLRAGSPARGVADERALAMLRSTLRPARAPEPRRTVTRSRGGK